MPAASHYSRPGKGREAKENRGLFGHLIATTQRRNCGLEFRQSLLNGQLQVRAEHLSVNKPFVVFDQTFRDVFTVANKSPLVNARLGKLFIFDLSTDPIIWVVGCITQARRPAQAGKIIELAGAYCGSGVALSAYIGTRVAEWMGGGATPALARLRFPLVPAPFEGRPWFLPVVGEWYRLRDRMAARTRPDEG